MKMSELPRAEAVVTAGRVIDALCRLVASVTAGDFRGVRVEATRLRARSNTVNDVHQARLCALGRGDAALAAEIGAMERAPAQPVNRRRTRGQAEYVAMLRRTGWLP